MYPIPTVPSETFETPVVVTAKPALKPIKTVLFAVVIFAPAVLPIAILSSPEVISVNADHPIAMFFWAPATVPVPIANSPIATL